MYSYGIMTISGDLIVGNLRRGIPYIDPVAPGPQTTSRDNEALNFSGPVTQVGNRDGIYISFSASSVYFRPPYACQVYIFINYYVLLVDAFLDNNVISRIGGINGRLDGRIFSRDVSLPIHCLMYGAHIHHVRWAIRLSVIYDQLDGIAAQHIQHQSGIRGIDIGKNSPASGRTGQNLPPVSERITVRIITADTIEGHRIPHGELRDNLVGMCCRRMI